MHGEGSVGGDDLNAAKGNIPINQLVGPEAETQAKVEVKAQGVTETFTFPRYLGKSEFVFETARSPLGIKIEQRNANGPFQVVDTVIGGAAELGTLPISKGDFIRGLSREVGKEGKKELVDVSKLKDMDELVKAILSNSDEKITVVWERPAPGFSFFLMDIAQQF